MEYDKNLKICPNGHRYYKSSACPTCPICEAIRKPTAGFQTLLSAPVRRALQQAKISTLQQLSSTIENTILNLHGMGLSAILMLAVIFFMGLIWIFCNFG